MKKTLFFGAAMLLVAMLMMPATADAQTRKDKKKAEKEKWEKQQQQEAELQQLEFELKKAQLQQQLKSQNANGARVQIPCVDASMDDAEYFREVGMGSDEDRGLSREKAIANAKVMIRQKMAEFVKGFSTDYSKTVRGTGAKSTLQGEVERMCNTAIEGMLDNAEKICEDSYRSDRGDWDSYYTVQIRKADIKEKMQQTLADKVGADKDQFQKVFDERADKLIQEGKNANR